MEVVGLGTGLKATGYLYLRKHYYEFVIFVILFYIISMIENI